VKAEDLMDAMGTLPDGIVEETDAVRKGEVILKTKKRRNVFRYVSAAACLCVLLAAFLIWNGQRADRGEYPDLPQLSVGSSAPSGYGYEGYIVSDAADLVNANPWKEQLQVTSLPVYKNTVELESMVPKQYDKERVLGLLQSAAQSLGLEESALGEIMEQPEMGALLCATAEVSLQADAFGRIRIRFQTPQTLPEGYTFRESAAYEDYEKAAEYLETEYSDVLAMSEPAVNIYGGDYDLLSNRAFHLSFYENSGDIAERIINYNFRQTEFLPAEDGGLWIIDMNQPDLSEKVGDYPVISVDEAGKLLEKGNYTTNAPCQLPGMDSIRKVELVYRTDIYEEYYMPYYKFYAELPEQAAAGDSLADTGMTTYGAYYVPAVEGRYIADMPVYDGTFN